MRPCFRTTSRVAAVVCVAFGAYAFAAKSDGKIPVGGQVMLATSAAAVAPGGRHTCALTASGGVKCWGFNFDGQLGDGTATSRSTPVNVTGLTSGVSAVASGQFHTCALTTGGGVKCWGYNFYGQLGDNTTTRRFTPVDVSGLTSGVIAVAAGEYHTCAVTSGGGVKCWGYNNSGQLGDGTTTQRRTPVDVSGLSSGVSAVDAADRHTCALTAGSGMKCWGLNSIGQLGDGTTTAHSTPVDVSGLTSGVIAVAAGGGHSCAVSTGGGVQCWGGNSWGQLGDTTTTTRLTPVAVYDLANATAVAPGGYHTCGLAAGGVSCWGNNSYGQLGSGSLVQQSTRPLSTIGLTSGVSVVASGEYHTCAVTSGGAVKCWGANSEGELGDGTTTSRFTPVDVSGFTEGGAGAPFTNPSLSVGVTAIRAVHVTELRKRIDGLRAAYGLGTFAWTDAALVAGQASIRGVHVVELRTALQQAYEAAGRTPPVYTDPVLTAGQTSIKAVHIAELRAAVVALE